MIDFTIQQESEGFLVLKNNKPLLTPQLNKILLPTKPLAESFIKEQKTPHSPFVKLLNTTIDFVQPQIMQKQKEMLDLLTYDTLLFWVNQPSYLAQKQNEKWNDIIIFLGQQTGCIPQKSFTLEPPKQALLFTEFFKNWLNELNAFQLTAFQEIALLLKSFLMSYLITIHYCSIEEAFQKTYLEELYQISLWGITKEQEERHRSIIEECLTNDHFFKLATHL